MADMEILKQREETFLFNRQSRHAGGGTDIQHAAAHFAFAMAGGVEVKILKRTYHESWPFD